MFVIIVNILNSIFYSQYGFFYEYKYAKEIELKTLSITFGLNYYVFLKFKHL